MLTSLDQSAFSAARALGWRWAIATLVYSAAAGSLAAFGDTRSALLLLAAVVVTLPLGLGAFIGVYFVYAILIGLAHVAGARVMTGNGWGPTWFVTLDELLVTLIFVTVAVANIMLVRRLGGRFLGRRRT